MYTEQNIRGLAINFLRQHYKLRPRMTVSGTRVVTKAHYYQGVTIDARLSYQKPNGAWFMATVEATSMDKAHEILYRVNWFRITAHSLFVALLAVALLLGIAQLAQTSVYRWFDGVSVYLFLITGFLALWTAAGALLSRLRYYRYIYAVAQFMRFHADAQWIAYDRRIFFAPLDGDFPDRAARRYARRMRRYYNELQRQCVRFGFGLMEVREGNEVRWLLEPSHIDQFAGQRGRLPQWMRAMTPPPLAARLGQAPLVEKTSPAPASALEDEFTVTTEDEALDPLAVGYLPPPIIRETDFAERTAATAGKRLPWYKQPVRFSQSVRWRIRHTYRSLYPAEIKNRPGYYDLPVWFIVATLVLIGGLFPLTYEQSRLGPLAELSAPNAAPALGRVEPADTPAESDASPEILPGEYDPDLTAREFARRSEYATAPSEIVASRVGERSGVSVLELDENHRARVSYDCLPLFLTQGKLYLLREGLYPEYKTAVERAEYLNDTYEVPVGVAARSCLDPLADDYFIYVGGIQVTEALANLAMRRLQGEMGLDLEAVAFE